MSNRLNDESATDTYEVFISYSHKDRLIAESLDTALEKWRVFLDQPRQEAGFEEEEPEDWGLLAGSSWKKQVASSLEDEPVVIVLMSQNSQSSAAVAHEIGAAVEAGLPIIAVSVDAATQIADQDMDAFPALKGPERQEVVRTAFAPGWRNVIASLNALLTPRLPQPLGWGARVTRQHVEVITPEGRSISRAQPMKTPELPTTGSTVSDRGDFIISTDSAGMRHTGRTVSSHTVGVSELVVPRVLSVVQHKRACVALAQHSSGTTLMVIDHAGHVYPNGVASSPVECAAPL